MVGMDLLESDFERVRRASPCFRSKEVLPCEGAGAIRFFLPMVSAQLYVFDCVHLSVDVHLRSSVCLRLSIVYLVHRDYTGNYFARNATFL
jgi:hypothetical protein